MSELEQPDQRPEEAPFEESAARRPHLAVLIAGWVSVVVIPFVAPVVGLVMFFRYRGSRAGLWITVASLALISVATVLRLTT